MTAEFPDIALQQLEKCARCGKCRSVCPVFDVVKDEAFVARGRILLADALRKNQISASNEIAAIMAACLMCRRCSGICPSGVEFTEVLKAARSQIAKEVGLPAGASFFFRHVLPYRRRFNSVIRIAALGQRLAPARRKGNLRHLPLLFKGGKWLPPLAKISALEAYSKPARVENARLRVGIFVGCLINYVYPDFIDATIQLLRRAQIQTIIPEQQLCCGTPAVALGDVEAARMLARRNQEHFREAGCDYVITLCASCGTMLKREYPQLLDSSENPFGVPMLDLSEFLVRHVKLDYGRLQDSVTYHDPCHLRWGQGVIAEPRKLLSDVCHFQETPGEMYCCALGGAFSLTFPDFSEAIAQKKLQSLDALSVREVVSACPGCILQLNDLFARSGSDKKAVHLIQILARSIKTLT
ncbi:MAG: (Fe-S)-binding protein [Candidatus Abyssobacteria bacterium SURF_5]|uniref:Glycolate oxidase iron-sulfur subunit n=1 Tax=Abyssobacteria bacterium (strain SURF_5) TaxID=2093360 RepID=A0A3A4P6R9_ABYX5|nr:MAG: (Fe-S)-binding protein [Candidatus Abyssubacteria bacterium SURF_5]